MSRNLPRTGGKAGDRKERGKRDYGDRPIRNRPKFKDSSTAKNLENEIANIEKSLKEAQREFEKLDNKIKVVRNEPRSQLKDKASINQRISLIKEKIADKQKEINKSKEEVKRLQEVANEKRSALVKLKNDVFFTNVKDGEFMRKNRLRQKEEISRLENRLETESLSLPEEKKIVKQIKKVKAIAKNFKPYQKKALVAEEAMDKFNKADREQKRKSKAIENWKDEIVKLQANLVTLAEKEQELKDNHEKIKQKQAQEEKKEVDIKTATQNKITEIARRLRDKREEQYEAREQFYRSIREKREKADEERQIERTAAREKYEEEERERAIADREAKKSIIPFSREMDSCNNLINYLRRFMPHEKKQGDQKKQSEKKEEKKDDTNQGYIKGRDEPEDIFGFTVKKKKRNRKKKNKAKKPVSNEVPHSLDTFSRFAELKLGNVPVVKSQVPAAIERIQVKLAELKKASSEKRAITLKQIAADEKAEKERAQKRKQREAEEKKGDAAKQKNESSPAEKSDK